MNHSEKDFIVSFTKKHHTWQKIFLSWLDQDPSININELSSSFAMFIKNKALLKSDITVEWGLSLLDNNNKLEVFSDKICKTLHIKKKNIFINSLKTNKYKHLFNESVEKEIHTILDNKISINSLKSLFFKKLAAYKSADALLKSLTLFKGSNIQWNKDYYLKKIKDEQLNCIITSDVNNGNNLMIHVLDYEACSKIGPQAWCIVRQERFFNHYTNNFKRQFIYLDFNLPIESIESMIGITCDIIGLPTNGHYKDDQSLNQIFLHSSQFRKIIPPTSDDDILFALNKKPEEALNLVSTANIFKFYDYCIDELYNVPADNNSEALFIASNNNSVDVIKRLLRDPSVDAYDRENILIRKMAYFGNYEIVKLLLLNEDVNVASHNNETVINAAINGNIKLFELLMNDSRVNIHAQDNMGFIQASAHGHVDILKIYIKSNHNISSTTFNKAIMVAANNKHCDVIDYICSATNMIIFNHNLSIAIGRISNEFLIKILKNNSLNINFDTSVFLKSAAFSGDLILVDFLLKQELCDPSVDDNRALSNAISNGHIKTASLLLKNKKVLDKLTDGWIRNKVILEYQTFFRSELTNYHIVKKESP
jgi:hypothetical protein